MTAVELFQDGRLVEAIRLQEHLVAVESADAAARLLLAELHLFQGDLAAVKAQLDRLPSERPGMAEYLLHYRQLLSAEAKRRRLFIDLRPALLSELTSSLNSTLTALASIQRHEDEAARDHLDDAVESAVWMAGHINGREFEGASDMDDLFSAVIELFLDDEYVWFPLEQVRRLQLHPRTSLRDHFWAPALLTSRKGDVWSVHLPVLYPGTDQHSEEEIRVGLSTDFESSEAGMSRGMGLHSLMIGEEELTLLDIEDWELRPGA